MVQNDLPPTPTVTIACCQSDRPFAERLASDLNRNGIRAQVSSSYSKDEPLGAKELRIKVGPASWFVIILSREWAKTCSFCHSMCLSSGKELRSELGDHTINRLLWCQIEECSLGDVLSSEDVEDFTGRPYDKAQERLSSRILGSSEGVAALSTHIGADLSGAIWEALYESLYKLTYRQREILNLAFGLGDGYVYTNEEIGRIFNITADEVSHIGTAALKRLATCEPIHRASLEMRPSDEGKHAVVLRDVIKQVKQLTPELISYLKHNEDDVDKLHPYAFEELVAEFFASWGFEDALVVGRDPRTSADVFAVERQDALGERLRYFVEVKRTEKRIGVGVIDKVLGAFTTERERFGWSICMIVSTAGFCDFRKYSRKELALRSLWLKDKDDVLDWLRRYQPSDKGLWLPPDFRLQDFGSSGDI